MIKDRCSLDAGDPLSDLPRVPLPVSQSEGCKDRGRQKNEGGDVVSSLRLFLGKAQILVLPGVAGWGAGRAGLAVGLPGTVNGGCVDRGCGSGEGCSGGDE